MKLLLNLVITVVEVGTSEGKGGAVTSLVTTFCISIVHKAPSMLRLVVICFTIFRDELKCITTIMDFKVGDKTCISRIVHKKVRTISQKRARTKQSLNLYCGSAVECVIVPRTIGGVLPTVKGRFVRLVGRASVLNCIKVISLAGTTDCMSSEACGVFVPLLTTNVICCLVMGLLSIFLEGFREELGRDSWDSGFARVI